MKQKCYVPYCEISGEHIHEFKEPTGSMFQLREITEKSFHSLRVIFAEKGEQFSCKFCDHPFYVGDKYKYTYTNSRSYCGNPNTCEKCAELPYDIRLKVWALMNDVNFQFRAAVKTVVRENFLNSCKLAKEYYED